MIKGKQLFSYLFWLYLIFCINSQAVGQNYIFAQLNGSPLNTAGWNMQGNAHVTNVTGTSNSEILLCTGRWSSGAAFCNQPINLSLCNKWIAEFDFRMFDGTGGDGMAFCFLDVPPVGFSQGGGLGIPGSANGLKVCFDTWNNCIPFDPNTVHQDMPKIEIRWGIGYDDYSNQANPKIGECVPEPTRPNSDGHISFIRSSEYSHAKITYDSGRIQVYVNDSLYLSGFQQFNFTGYLGFTASTGDYTDNHSIKNAVIYTKMPPSFAGIDQQFCPNDTIQLGGPGNTDYKYEWVPSIYLSDSSVSAPYLHFPNDSTNTQIYKYYVNTSFKNNPGCASRDSVTIKVYPTTKVGFITPEICLTDAKAQFYDSSYSRDSTTSPFTYKWNFGDPNAQAGNPDSSMLKDPFHYYSAASNYNITLTITNSKGCTSRSSKIFTVNGVVPKAAFQVKNATTLCSNQTVNIINGSSVDFGSITKMLIYWGDTALQSYTDNEPYPGKIYSHYFPNPVSANRLLYTIRMISFSGITCQNETDQQIVMLPSPHVQFDGIPVMCEYDSPIMITQAGELTGLPGAFSFAGKGISEIGMFDPKESGPGEFELVYKYTDLDGCIDSASRNITVLAPPKVTAGNDTSIVMNQPLQLEAVTDSRNGITFLWSPPTGLTDPGIFNPVAIIPSTTDDIKYTVHAIDTAGCFSEASIVVKVFKTAPGIFVPNAFTPGQAVNNIFRPIPVGISSLQYFRVYNRWGQMVFSTSHMGDGWDGTLAGKPQETGSYVWMVQGETFMGNIINEKGTMVLIR